MTERTLERILQTGTEEEVRKAFGSSKLWYAVLEDKYDADWGTGSEDIAIAAEMARQFGGESHIAIIDNDRNPVCIGTIDHDDLEMY